MTQLRTESPPRLRVLYIHPGNSPPSMDPGRNASFHLSQYLDGDLVTISWDERPVYRQRHAQYAAALGRFGYHASLSSRMPSPLRDLWQTVYYLGACVWLSMKNGRYDAIVVYGPYKTSLAALMAKAITGSALIVQMITNPYKSLTLHSDTLVTRLKQRFMKAWIPFLMRFVDHVHLLHPDQKTYFRRSLPTSVFPDFTATSCAPPDQGQSGFLLFVGFPWRLKGVDVLIRAFNRISAEFPSLRLKIVGHCPDRRPFLELAGGNPAIEFSGPLSHAEVFDLMSRCDFFVLPSRTEAMPRVIMEAWAAGKAVVASAVDGIPHYLHDGTHGLLVPPGDVDALAEAMRRLLLNPDQARAMGANGRLLVESRYGERHYAMHFRDMVEAAARRRGRRSGSSD